MSEAPTNRSELGRAKAADGEAHHQEPPRIQIDVPMGTPYQEIQESIFRQAYQHAGTQLRAAIALGITPDTVSCILRRSDRRTAASPRVPEAWPVVATNGASATPGDRLIEPSGHPAIDRENESPVALASSPEIGQEDSDPSSMSSSDTQRNEL